jgi:hypothetical protein
MVIVPVFTSVVAARRVSELAGLKPVSPIERMLKKIGVSTKKCVDNNSSGERENVPGSCDLDCGDVQVAPIPFKSISNSERACSRDGKLGIREHEGSDSNCRGACEKSKVSSKIPGTTRAAGKL